MSVWLILPMVIGAALVFRILSVRYRIVRYCGEKHQVESISLFRHHSMVPCDMALWVARNAQELWKELRADFPEETLEPFGLSVIWNPREGPGWKPENESRAVINPVYFFLRQNPPPSFQSQEQAIRGTVAEEVHHIGWARKYGKEPYRFRSGDGEGRLGEVIYYAVNRSEYEALKFVVRTTGDRADLLEEVEEYRRKVD